MTDKAGSQVFVKTVFSMRDTNVIAFLTDFKVFGGLRVNGVVWLFGD